MSRRQQPETVIEDQSDHHGAPPASEHFRSRVLVLEIALIFIGNSMLLKLSSKTSANVKRASQEHHKLYVVRS